MITASALSRLMNCPGSVVLPKAEIHNVWADMGVAEHDELSDFAELPEEISRHIPAGARSEIKVAYDVFSRKGRIIGEGAGRDYGTPASTEICGSSDVIGVEGDDVVVVDFKTGFADVEPAATNRQLAFYALAACSELKRDSAIVRIIYTKMDRVDEARLGPLDLAAFANELEHLFVKVVALQKQRDRGEVVPTREGAWCKHCSAKASCPSKNALLVQISQHGLAKPGDVSMSAERAVEAYRQLTMIEQLVKEGRKRLEVYVDDNGPIDLGDGKLYGRYVRKGNETLDGNVAVQAIRELVESSKEFEAIAIERTVTTTKAAIKRAAESLVGKGANKLAAAVVQRIRDLGGTTTAKPSRPIGEFPKTGESAAKPVIDLVEVNRLLESA